MRLRPRIGAALGTVSGGRPEVKMSDFAVVGQGGLVLSLPFLFTDSNKCGHSEVFEE